MLICLAALAPVLADGIEDLDAAWVRAAKAGNVDAVVELYAPGAVLYPPDSMEARGTDAIRKVYTDMLGGMTIKDFVFLEQNYTTKGSLSVGWGRFLLAAESKGGAPIKMEGRFSSVAEKKEGKWHYVLVHASVPSTPLTPVAAPAPPSAALPKP